MFPNWAQHDFDGVIHFLLGSIADPNLFLELTDFRKQVNVGRALKSFGSLTRLTFGWSSPVGLINLYTLQPRVFLQLRSLNRRKAVEKYYLTLIFLINKEGRKFKCSPLKFHKGRQYKGD